MGDTFMDVLLTVLVIPCWHSRCMG